MRAASGSALVNGIVSVWKRGEQIRLGIAGEGHRNGQQTVRADGQLAGVRPGGFHPALTAGAGEKERTGLGGLLLGPEQNVVWHLDVAETARAAGRVASLRPRRLQQGTTRGTTVEDSKDRGRALTERTED